MRITRALMVGMLLASLPVQAFAQRAPILGAKVYRQDRPSEELLKLAKSLGLNALFAGDELAAPEEFREECWAGGLKYLLTIRTFNGPKATRQ